MIKTRTGTGIIAASALESAATTEATRASAASRTTSTSCSKHRFFSARMLIRSTRFVLFFLIFRVLYFLQEMDSLLEEMLNVESCITGLCYDAKMTAF